MIKPETTPINSYNGPYRGIVMLNEDPDNLCRVKVYVETVYDPSFFNNPVLLPWAELAQDFIGGNANTSIEESVFKQNKSKKIFSFKNTGKNSVPHKGSMVWVFFEGGNPNYPIVFAAIQGGSTSVAEHPNQHTIITDNVKIVIDEDLDNDKSTQSFLSNNTDNSTLSQIAFEPRKIKTRVNIEVLNKDQGSVNINLVGDVNMHIDGNLFSEVIGDIHETHIGNKYIYHKGDTYIEEKGNTIYNITDGNYKEMRNGNRELLTTGWSIDKVDGNKKTIVLSSMTDLCAEYTTRISLLGIKDGSQLIQHVKETSFPNSCREDEIKNTENEDDFEIPTKPEEILPKVVMEMPD